MKETKDYHKIMVKAVFLIGIVTLMFWRCGSVQHQAKLNKEYLPKEDLSIKVAKVVNDTGFTFDIDIEDRLAVALEDQLLEEDLLWLGGNEPALIMESRIVEYKKGDAFKRWMMPGWGATELSIRCELKDDKNHSVGSVAASREIAAGGGYTIGAWETVFKDVAKDVAKDLRGQLESLGYDVQPKYLPEITADKPIAAFYPVKVDPTEPWTGMWKVEGSQYSGIWRMKQTESVVKSNQYSSYEFKGKVKGNQMKGRLVDTNTVYSLVLTLSSDGISFEGYLRGAQEKSILKGRKIR